MTSKVHSSRVSGLDTPGVMRRTEEWRAVYLLKVQMRTGRRWFEERKDLRKSVLFVSTHVRNKNKTLVRLQGKQRPKESAGVPHHMQHYGCNEVAGEKVNCSPRS